MRSSPAALAALLWSTSVLAIPQIQGETLTGTVGNSTIAGSSSGPDSNGKYVIQGVGIRANFIPYGASISNLFINDTSGIERDIVGGFDNASYYSIVSILNHGVQRRRKFERGVLMEAGPPTSAFRRRTRALCKPHQEQQFRDRWDDV
jgi:hypothetical protein